MATLTSARLAIPYPDGAERVRDGDNAMGAIANTLDDLAKVGIPFRMQAGRATHSPAAVTQTSVTVTFTAGRFTVAPIVVQSVWGAGLSTITVIRMSANPTNTGFNSIVNYSASATGTFDVAWIAVQMLAANGSG